MVQNTPENRKKCLCPKCPSFPRDCGGEILYCAAGKSKCEIAAKGCVCPECPVYYANDLKELYYCDKEKAGGSGIFMRKKRAGEDNDFYQKIVDVKTLAAERKSKICAMGSKKKLPFSFDDLHFTPAQVYKIPLNKEEKVNAEITIGPKSQKPLKLASPILVSGMSYGAVSKKTREVISKTAAKLKVGFNSGEGGILEDELKAGANYMIGQYATGRFGITEEKLKKVAAIEIRFGQGAYPGKGSYLSVDKITADIANVRGLRRGEAAYSPARHSDMTTPEQIKDKISYLKKLTGGAPIGAKIGCGNVEKDIEILAEAGADFIAIDGFGGGTGATDCYIRENVGIPILAALPRAARILKKLGAKNKISLIAGGGLSAAADFAKCLALGADAVYIGTAALIAINCEQYRICHTGLCPTGVTTHDPTLLKQLDVKKGIERLANFINISTEEIASFARIIGKNDVKNLDSDDLVSLNKDLAEIAGVRWMNGEFIKQSI
jgi:methylamine---glutamate N-methyltransferase subunit C